MKKLRQDQIAEDMVNPAFSEETRAILRALDHVANDWIGRGVYIGMGLSIWALILAMLGLLASAFLSGSYVPPS